MTKTAGPTDCSKNAERKRSLIIIGGHIHGTLKKKGATTWFSEETVCGRTDKTLTVILKTSGCSWKKQGRGCLMCGYHADSRASISPDEVHRQVEDLSAEGADTVKIYTSGSFLDGNEVAPNDQTRILEHFQDQNVVVETRPQFVTEKTLSHLADYSQKLELAFGLETSDDRVRKTCINKGFSFQDYENAIEKTKKNHFRTRTYLLFKPPFLTEKDAIVDLENSMRDVLPLTDVVSINPVNVQRDTFLQKIYRKGFYRPPWFHSLFEVLEKFPDEEVMSIPSGAKTPRGIHNCRKCDDQAMTLLDEYNATKDPRRFQELRCSCKREWEKLKVLENATKNAKVNYRSQNRDW